MPIFNIDTHSLKVDSVTRKQRTLTKGEGSASTVDLLVKITSFVKNISNVINI
jgi:hypothetical protein